MTNIIDTLKTGVHALRHTKKDGTIVTRMATLDPSLIPVFIPKTDRKTPTAEYTFRVWDVTKAQWVTVAENTAEIV